MLMRVLSLLVIPSCLIAQQGVVMNFTPQGRWLGLDSYLVTMCNTTEDQIEVHVAQVFNAAASRGLYPASYSRVNQELEKARRVSPVSILMTVSEFSAWALTVLTTTEAIWGNAPRWQKFIPPVAGGALRMAGPIVRRHSPRLEKPDDLMPTYLRLEARPGGCATKTILTVPEQGR